MRSDRIWWWGSLILGCLVCVGCPSTTTQSRTQNGEQTEASAKLGIRDYFPLKVGDSRVYRIRFAGSKEVIEREIKIVRKVGKLYYDNDNPPQTYEYDANGLRVTNLRYMLKHPLRVGVRWLSVTGITSVEHYQITDIGRTVNVPAGTYKDCVVVRSREQQGRKGTLENTMIFAPHIGPVKIVTQLKTKGGQFPQWELELVSYRPGASG